MVQRQAISIVYIYSIRLMVCCTFSFMRRITFVMENVCFAMESTCTVFSVRESSIGQLVYMFRKKFLS